jgi:dienelactone hydrolase
MGIQFNCMDCGQDFAVDDHWAGKRAKCRACGNIMEVPGARRAAPPPLPRRKIVVTPHSEDEPIPPNVMKLIIAILGVGLFACVCVLIPWGKKGAEQSASNMTAASAVETQAADDTSSNDSAPAPTPVAPAAPTINYPQRPAPLKTTPDIEVYPMTLRGTAPGMPMQVRLYLPQGRHEMHSLPCVFIAPAGTAMLYGSALGDGDSPEHVPYAQKGFAVLAYELSGDLQRDPSGSMTFGQVKGPVRQFMAADGGLANARAAVSFVLSAVPEVDPARLYAAGHSSAATMALNVVAADHRFRAVAAYAPCTDVEAHWSRDLQKLDHFVPGAADLAKRVSPIQHVNDIQCPIFLFHADDDSKVTTQDITTYNSALNAASKTVQLMRVPTGDHYDSMIQQGIPAGIEFFKSQGANPLPPDVHRAFRNRGNEM